MGIDDEEDYFDEDDEEDHFDETMVVEDQDEEPNSLTKSLK